jgi:hypothetical protein
MLDKLKEVRAKLDAVIAEIEGKPSETTFTKKPLPLHAKAAYDACRQMWEAADMARRSGEIGAPDFDKFRYIGGILPGGQVRIPEKGPSEMQADIVALGHSVWGQQWLSNDSNAAQIDPDYLRHFLGYRVVRKAQNDESQGYNRVP